MTTYKIRIDHFADNEDIWHAYTLLSNGIRHSFGEMTEADAKRLQADLEQLHPNTIAILVGDASEYPGYENAAM